MGLGDLSDEISGNGKIIVLTSFVMLLIVIAVSMLVFFISLKSADKVMVPNVVGKDFIAATIEMQAKELYPKVQLRYTEDVSKAGRVLEQDPSPGAIVKGGKYIDLVVSQGTVIDKIDNYIGESIEDVQQKLQLLFTSGNKQYISIKQPYLYKYSRQPAGTILEQNPAPDTPISSNVQLEFVVSKGMEKETVKVPQITGKTLPELYKMMVKSSVCFNFVQGEASTKTYAEIVSQNPAAGMQVPANSFVNATVSFPADSGTDEVYGILSVNLPKYPYPFTVSLDASYTNGNRIQLVSFKHTGGECLIPYGVPSGTLLVLSVSNKEIYSFEVKR
ncbi:PASTA domain-containing protein [Treponema phagedenis]|uniref:PASTA domain-containing protein n=1 Tax=Treponema phagedenis TaxID=162 RepID=UPI0011F00767|nr:PASTA domain-containing protein [Treponema phagedenis]TYT77856.1 PASTA domain-containing protein [Treponema phagedenis]